MKNEDLRNISTKYYVVETVVDISTQFSGNWFKERLGRTELLKAGIETARNNSLLFLILGPKLTETKSNLSLQFHIG